MLYFQNEQWLMVYGESHLSAYITPKDRTREDVHWMLDMQFRAGGAVWRRVHFWERPTVFVSLTSFEVPGTSWKDLEKIDYWDEPDEEDPSMRSGMLDVSFDNLLRPESQQEDLGLIGCQWRVARRDASWFTLEMAICTGDEESPPKLEEKTAVLSDGTEEKAEAVEPDEAYWRKHATLYLLEAVPFGVVTVRVPRNARNVEAYALARARELIGVGEPEHVEVQDYYQRAKPSESLQDEIHVRLHFNGYHGR